MKDDPDIILEVAFFKTEAGVEPVRDWLKSLPAGSRKTMGADIKTVQFGWPLGMPLVRKLGKDLWEVRSRTSEGIGRVMFTVVGRMHGARSRFRQEIAKDAIARTRYRAKRLRQLQQRGEAMRRNRHIGSNFDSFLEDEGLLAQAEAIAAKRVLAFLIEREMKRQRLSKSEMALKMGTSRAALDRLLDPQNTAITLRTMERSASVLGKKLKIQLV